MQISGKNRLGDFQKVYLSKTQKKRQQDGQELALVSLVDLDGFVRAEKHAECNGQNYDIWPNSLERRPFSHGPVGP